MPNWVCNHLIIRGEKALDVFHSLLVENKDNDFGYDFDFNKIKPMPEELNVVAGTVTERCAKLYVNAMMNDCDAYLKYSKLFTEAFGRDFYLTEAEQAESMAEVLRYKDYPDEKLLFSNKAEAYAYGKRALDNYAKYGAKDWYDWCVKNWGTKWNACDTQVNDYGKPEVYFNTAWGSIPELLCALSEQNPGCEFEYEYADEDVGFHTGFYLFKNGKVIEGGPYDDQSRGAYETYFALWGGETDFRFNAKTGTYEYIDGEESM